MKKALPLSTVVLVTGAVAAYFLFVRPVDRGPPQPPSFSSRPAERKDPLEQPVNPNFWNRTRGDILGRLTAAERTNAPDEADLARLQALGYLEGYRKKPADRNITIHDPEQAFAGYNLYVTGKLPGPGYQKEVRLIDMTGRLVHGWKPALPDPLLRTNWRRLHLYEDGDLLIVVENMALVRLDSESNVEWIYPGNPHHDLFLDDEGNIYLLTKRVRHLRKYRRGQPVYDDSVCILDPDGNEQRCVSMLDSIERSPYASVLDGINPKHEDILHSNTVAVLDGRLADRSDAFARGNVLVSIRNLSAICILDLRREVVVWMETGDWKFQHSPTVLDNGNLLVFDNNPSPADVESIEDPELFIKRFQDWPDAVQEGAFSRVVELDPFTREVVWEYTGEPDFPFYSFVLGRADRLPNGNTLITESVAGRAFEVTRDGEIVWEFINPNTTGENHELIATLLEMTRVPVDFPLSWVAQP
jgi:hypothetical protein